MQPHSSLQILSKCINKDLSNLSNWLKTNELSLNIKKTKLALLRPKKLKLDHSFEFKIDGKILIPIHLVKVIGIPSKLSSHVVVNTLRIEYYSVFHFNLICNMG